MPLTTKIKEIAVERAVQTMYRNFFIDKQMFTLENIFSEEDNLTPEQQDQVMSLAIAELEQDTVMKVLRDGKRYIISLPEGLREHQCADNTDTDKTIKMKTVQLTISLALIYFYRGKMLENDLMYQLQRFLPFLGQNGSDFTENELLGILKDFESKGLIVRKRTKGGIMVPPNTYVYWGFRAKKECNKQNLIPIYCMMFKRDKKDLPISLLEIINKNEDFYDDIYDQ